MTSGSASDTSGTTRTNEDYELRVKAVDALMETFQHDPLCYMAEGKWDGGCQCSLIAKVRADQAALSYNEGYALGFKLGRHTVNEVRA